VYPVPGPGTVAKAAGWMRAEVSRLQGPDNIEVLDWRTFATHGPETRKATTTPTTEASPLEDSRYSFDGTRTLILERKLNRLGDMTVRIYGGMHREVAISSIQTPHELTWYVGLPKSSLSNWIVLAAQGQTKWHIEDQHCKEIECITTVKLVGVQFAKPHEMTVTLWVAPDHNFMPVKLAISSQNSPLMLHIREMSDLHQLPNGLWYAGRIRVQYGIPEQGLLATYTVRSISCETVKPADCRMEVPAGAYVHDLVSKRDYRTPRNPRSEGMRHLIDDAMKEGATKTTTT